jgi:hypothetical protein
MKFYGKTLSVDIYGSGKKVERLLVDYKKKEGGPNTLVREFVCHTVLYIVKSVSKICQISEVTT